MSDLINLFDVASSCIEITARKGRRGCNLDDLNELIINELCFDRLFRCNYLAGQIAVFLKL